jgi:serine protein kinase
MFERYFMYADAWIQDNDFRDPDTHQMWDRDQLNAAVAAYLTPTSHSA